MLDLAKASADLDAINPQFVKLAWAIVDREGGYVDNPDDPGGPTNYGVSLKHARAEGMAFDIDHDGVVDAKDIRELTPEMAVVDFLETFLIEPGIDKLPACLVPCVFDHAVNGGPAAAIKLVQMTINKLGFGRVAEDGKLGPLSDAAAADTERHVGDVQFVNALVDERDAEYRRIVDENPNLNVFLKGWLTRANSFRK